MYVIICISSFLFIIIFLLFLYCYFTPSSLLLFFIIIKFLYEVDYEKFMKINVIGLVLIVFLVFSGFLIVKSNNYDLSNSNDSISFAKKYSSWLWDTSKKSAKVVGAVIKDVANENWLPENISNNSEMNETESDLNSNDDKSIKVKLIYE